jgi:hypothetical protein
MAKNNRDFPGRLGHASKEVLKNTIGPNAISEAVREQRVLINDLVGMPTCEDERGVQ